MRPTLRAISARLIVGHLDTENAADLLAAIDIRGKPITLALAEPDGMRLQAAVPAGMGAETARYDPLRWGKLVIETVANEAVASTRPELCDAIVDGLRVAHRRLGPEGLDIVPHDSSGVGFCAATMVDGGVQLIVVPPAQVFVVHQGVALCIPQSAEVGRGIWVRDDLRAEIFAGIGGAHEPDIRVYDAAIGPGDSLVLTSASLARMLTEEDVRLAVAYEEASTAAERLKQLATQRGVEAGVALVVEIAGSFDEPGSPESSGPIVLGGVPRPSLRVDMPPIGSIFSTARDWLLEAVDRVQTGQSAPAAQPRRSEAEDIPVRWPTRPAPGAWRRDFQAAAANGFRRPAPAQDSPDAAAPGQPETWQHPEHSSALSSHNPAQENDGGAQGDTPAAPRRTRIHVREGRRNHDVDTASSGTRLHGRDAASIGGNYTTLAAGWRRQPAARRRRGGGQVSVRRLAAASGLHAGQAASRARTALLGFVSQIANRAARMNLAGKRQFLVPIVALLCALLVVFGVVRTIKSQQARQVQQRFDSLVTAAGQLETQARNDGDRNEAQGLIRRAQALVDQAATLQPNQPRIASLRKDLQGDLDRLDNVLPLPDPVVLANLASVAKGVSAGQIVADASAIYTLDSGGQRVIQFTRQAKQASVAVSSGDKSGANQLAAPKLVAIRDAGLLVLDGNRNLWSYSPADHLQQIGLKSADTWKDATAIAAYGPNVYVLDAVLGNIFRYASRDGIFTDAPTRFFEKDTPDLLHQAVSLAIDGSIWVLNSDGQIFKLEGGARQPFNISGLPQPIAKASQIATQAGYRSLYVLDVGNNRVVEIAKDGRYLRQFNLNLPAPATGLWPDEPAHQLYVAAGNTLYQFQLPS